MKNLLSIILLLSFSLASFSQKKKNEILQFYDAAGKTTKEKDAKYITRILVMNDTCWQFHRYKIMAPMISLNEYRDKEGKILHGRSSCMRPDGTLDSSGQFVNGKPNGTWLYFTSSGNIGMKKEYSMGELVSTWNAIDNNSGKKDSINNEPDVQAQFPGSAKGWSMYLISNLRYPVYARERRIQGAVILYFQVDTDGRVQEEMLLKSAELTLDNEGLRLLKESPSWLPATKNGQKVKSYVQQPVTFRLE
jgi:TonB family protein